jgi:hypothetical protein
MKKPHLVVTQHAGIPPMPIQGECSACQDIHFVVGGGSPSENAKMLEAAFEKHFKDVHLKEDASQAAARVVREATGHSCSQCCR